MSSIYISHKTECIERVRFVDVLAVAVLLMIMVVVLLLLIVVFVVVV